MNNEDRKGTQDDRRTEAQRTNDRPAENANAPEQAPEHRNYDQAHTPAQHRQDQKDATEEAARQKREGAPGTVPLPTSGQPLTAPEPDAAREAEKK